MQYLVRTKYTHIEAMKYELGDFSDCTNEFSALIFVPNLGPQVCHDEGVCVTQ